MRSILRKNIITAIVIGIIIISGLSLFGLSRGPKPIIQPIPFSHNIHVEDQDLECSLCHTQVTKHPRATLPSITTCQTCHSEPMTETEIEKTLLSYTDENREIPWKRVYNVPDHVYFSHRRHVTIGNVLCESCHGEMGQLTEPPSAPLINITMDYCMECHEEHKITNDCLACHR